MRLNIGEKYIVTITEIKPFGAVIQFKDESTQMLHISHISDTFVQNIEEFMNVGEQIEVYAIPGKVKSVELTIRQSEIDRYESCDGKSFEELLNDYPPNEKDIRYKDRISSGKYSGKKKKHK